MVRSPPGCSKDGFKKGAWTADENRMLRDYVKVHGEGRWSNVARATGLKRCGKSCRLRWKNYLRSDIKIGNISQDEEELVLRLHKLLGNRWSLIAGRLPGRTDNEIKNYWNTNLAKRAPDSPLPSRGLLLPPPPAAVVFTCTGQPQGDKEPAGETTANVPDDRGCISAGDDNSSSGFVVDFDVDYLCKFLDMDFADNNKHANGVVAGVPNGVDLMSFLDSTEEWPEREINAS